MKKWKVWSEGYSATGERGYAKLEGTAKAETFKEACDIVCAHHRESYDPKRLRVWGCRLFDNEKQAREVFG